MSILLDEYIASRYGVHHGAQKEFLADNPHMGNPEVSRWIKHGWRIDFSTGSVFKESNKKINLKDAQFDVVSRSDTIRLTNSDNVYFITEADVKEKVNGVLIKGVTQDGFFTISKNDIDHHNAPVQYNTVLWNENGNELKIEHGFVIAEVAPIG